MGAAINNSLTYVRFKHFKDHTYMQIYNLQFGPGSTTLRQAPEAAKNLWHQMITAILKIQFKRCVQTFLAMPMPKFILGFSKSIWCLLTTNRYIAFSVPECLCHSKIATRLIWLHKNVNCTKNYVYCILSRLLNNVQSLKVPRFKTLRLRAALWGLVIKCPWICT